MITETILLLSLMGALLLLAWALFPKQLLADPSWLLPQRRSIDMSKEASRSRLAQKRVIVEYKNRSGKVFKVGDRVKLDPHTAFIVNDPLPENFAGQPITRSTIVSFLPDAKGWVLLENKLGGFWTWSVDDLRHTNRRQH